MDMQAFGGYDGEGMCNPNLRTEEKRMPRQQVTSNGFGSVCREKGKKSPPRVAK
jgi:hypothetical protein